MDNYLFATVGGRDVKFKNECVDDGNNLCATDWSGKKTSSFVSPRETGKTISEDFNRWESKLEYPIIEPAIDYCIDNNYKPEKIFLFVSNQTTSDKSDTVYLGQILKSYIKGKKKIDCDVIELTGNPAFFDDQYDLINEKLSEIEKELNPTEDSMFIFPQTGMPATRNALLLNCILYFSKIIQLQKPRGEEVTEQHFPQKFRDQVRIKSLKSTLKETLATISARNLSHTDGSHVMISFQKNQRRKLDELQKTFSTSKIENLKKNYDAFSDYLRGQMEYIADINGQTASHTFFDYNFNSGVEKLNDIMTSFLGKGLIDDLEQKVGGNTRGVGICLIYENNGDKIVSIPGGSNGINAFYTILKNFIRNLYKHSSYVVRNDSAYYDINIKLEDSTRKDYYKVTLYDAYEYKGDQINQIIEGSNGTRGIEQCINDKLLDNEGVVRDYGWGILEMKIAAFYLMGLPLMYFDEPANAKNEIDLSKKEMKKVFPKPLNVTKCDKHLAYEFYLLKPETFYVISTEMPDNEVGYQEAGINFSGSKKDSDMNTRAKFIIHSKENGSFPLKLNNIRQINFFNEKFSSLLNEQKREEIISEWQKRMFLKDGQEFDHYTKVDLSVNANGDLNEEQKNSLTGNNLVVIDSHGNAHSKMSFSEIKAKRYFYYSTSCSKDIQDIPPKEFKDLKWEEIEAIFTKVAVLDERIQHKTHEAQNYIHKLSKRDLLELRGVFVPPLPGDGQDENAFDLGSFIYGKTEDTANVDKLETVIQNYMEDYHYVVMHFSVLEKMADMKKKKLSEYYKGLADKVAVENHYLILTSGKGTPSTLPEGSYFINFSTVERAINSLSKVELVQHLNALRIYHKSNKP